MQRTAAKHKQKYTVEDVLDLSTPVEPPPEPTVIDKLAELRDEIHRLQDRVTTLETKSENLGTYEQWYRQTVNTECKNFVESDLLDLSEERIKTVATQVAEAEVAEFQAAVKAAFADLRAQLRRKFGNNSF